MTRRLVELPRADLDDMQRMFSVPQTAERLDLSKRMVYQLIEDGELEAVTVGTGEGLIRITAAALQAFIDTRPKHVPRQQRRGRQAAMATS